MWGPILLREIIFYKKMPKKIFTKKGDPPYENKKNKLLAYLSLLISRADNDVT
jgi:hypothetical protein